jgi:hypothetical protein
MNGTAAAVMKKGTILFKDIHVREQHLTRKVNRESVFAVIRLWMLIVCNRNMIVIS